MSPKELKAGWDVRKSSGKNANACGRKETGNWRGRLDEGGDVKETRGCCVLKSGGLTLAWREQKNLKRLSDRGRGQLSEGFGHDGVAEAFWCANWLDP